MESKPNSSRHYPQISLRITFDRRRRRRRRRPIRFPANDVNNGDAADAWRKIVLLGAKIERNLELWRF